MYRDVHGYCRSCDACQKTTRLATQSLAKLVTKSSRGTIYEMGA